MRRSQSAVGRAYRRVRRFGAGGATVGVIVLTAMLAGCSSSGSTATTTSKAPPTTTGTSTTVAAATTSKVVPAPIGYAVETQGTTNGPITAPAFDKAVGTGSAASYHFTDGYDVTYANTATDESIEVTLFTFETPADASAFLGAVVQVAPAASLAPKWTTLLSLPGSTVLTSTKAGSDGFYVTDVMAQKYNHVMVLEYANDSPPNGMPPALASAVHAQYHKL